MILRPTATHTLIMKTTNLSPRPTTARPTLSNIRRLCGGFSLVEIAIAMGLVTFSMVAVIGLLPVGLSTLRKATANTVEAQIVNRIAADAALIPFQNLGEFAANVLHFDNEGRRVISPTEGIFFVELEVDAPSYPGMPSDIGATLVNLQVSISTPQTALGNSRIYNLLVSRSDRMN